MTHQKTEAECPNCGWSKKVTEKAYGKKGECPECGKVFVIGKSSSSKADEVVTFGKTGHETDQDGIGWAITSFVCGIVGLVFSWTVFGGVLLGTAAIVFYGLQNKSHKLATAGLVTGIIAVSLSFLVWLPIMLAVSPG